MMTIMRMCCAILTIAYYISTITVPEQNAVPQALLPAVRTQESSQAL